jgi:hypothetical protein
MASDAVKIPTATEKGSTKPRAARKRATPTKRAGTTRRARTTATRKPAKTRSRATRPRRGRPPGSRNRRQRAQNGSIETAIREYVRQQIQRITKEEIEILLSV